MAKEFKMSSRIRLGIVGCGAVAAIHHLPALSGSNQFKVETLVDQDLERARKFASQYQIPNVSRDYEELFNTVDAAIVALPNYLHAPVAIDLLKHGIHALVEKPMALNILECDQMIEAAKSAGRILAVGLDYRFIRAAEFTKQMLDAGVLGGVDKFDLRLGVHFNWPMNSNYLLQKETAGGGVLMDFGPHVLDLLLWWLGDYDRVEYHDDAFGGVESNCEVRLRLKGGSSGTIELSRSRKLRNTCIMYGAAASLEVGIWDFNPQTSLTINNKRLSLSGAVMQDGSPDESWLDLFRREHEDFALAILGQGELFIPAEEGKRAVKLIESCYGSRQPVNYPWIFSENQPVKTEGNAES